ncbi:MAG TPA: glycogen synthase GlgA [Burkholderiales bacterium]|nr:glycogen synthase GlgA [Burkholderiales bacterium]
MSAANRLAVLFVTSEVAPLIKTGGLADVAGSLPAALMHAGVDARVLVPGYKQVMEGVKSKGRLAAFPALGDMPASQILAGKLPSGVPLMIIDCPRLYDRPGGPYQDSSGSDWPDNAVRFGLLSYVGAVLSGAASPISWRPRLIQCNDWQTGLAPAYLHFMPGDKARSLVTIHNLAYQGVFPPTTASRLGLPPSSFGPDGVEYYGNMSFLKAALYYADHITTVSPNYAREIQQEPLGMGMQGLLAHRAGALTGILNGIDTDAWDPETDPYIHRYYNAVRLPAKQENKQALQERMGLAVDEKVPLLATIGRFTYQKGLDLLLEIAPDLVRLPAQLAVLGAGDAALQDAFQALARANAGRVAVQVGYDEGLAHQIEAGADIFLMPSRFEPCGLNQMYSQRYGTPPVVHDTGGLHDSVVDCQTITLADKSATGFLFEPMSRDGFTVAVRRSVEAYHDKKTWRQLQKNGMARDFSWDASAQRYIALYESLITA